jgi:hypothetical protein
MRRAGVYAAAAGIAVLAAAAAFFAARKAIAASRARKAGEMLVYPDSPESVANELWAAFFGGPFWGAGTDEKAAFAALDKVVSKKHWTDTASAYRRLFGRDLNADARAELADGGEYVYFMRALQAKP